MFQVLLYGGLAGALISLIIAVILFIKLDIPQVIQDLLGIRRTPKTREKRRRRDKRAQTTTDNISRNHTITKNPTEVTDGSLTTELLYDEVAATALLEAEDPNETTLLHTNAEETALLDGQETTLLRVDQNAASQSYFKKQLDIIVVHSDMRI